MKQPMVIDCETVHRALELYKMWDADQNHLGLRGQLSLWVDAHPSLGLRWRIRVEPELAGRAFELSGF